MKWKNLSLGKKLAMGFGTTIILLMISATVSYNGITQIKKDTEHAILSGELYDLFSEKIIDHYKWLNKVDIALLDKSALSMNVQTDHHKCKLGTWLYGEGGKKAETEFPLLAPLLKSLEDHHTRMHASAKTINQIMARGRTGENADSISEKLHEVYNRQSLPSLKELESVMTVIREALNKNKSAANERLDKVSEATSKRVLVISIIAILFGLGCSLFMTRYLTGIISKLGQFTQKLSRGDFTGKLDIKQKDELGRLAESLEKTTRDLSTMFSRVINEVVSLSSSSSTLFNVSKQLSDGAENMSSRANTVAAATEEMSSNMNSVAAASEQASTNVNMVATATEEMTATVKDIAGSSEKARGITEDAVEKAKSASTKVSELGLAATQISKVTEAITEISEQTNLLALNATIEAARAGEAGKGFAVVANEIKDLAKQTADATQDIKSKVDGIQTSTSGTVKEIEQITTVIDSVNEIVSSIAKAVEEQATTTQDIAENVTQASQGIQEVNENVSQTSMVSSEIAKDISQVSGGTAEISDSSSQVSDNAGDLSAFASKIKEMVGQFKIDPAL